MSAGYLRAALCSFALAAAACDDWGMGPEHGAGRSDELSAPQSMDRFSIQIKAAGSFRPGQPVQLTVIAAANLRTSDAEIRLVLPEVASARESSWERPQYPVGRPLTPEFSQRTSMARGHTITRVVNVTVPRAGYYQVVASAVQRSGREQDESPPNGQNDQDVAHDEVWIWISESGGRVTERFEPEHFPAGTWKVPGPLTPVTQSRPGASSETATGPRPSGSAGPRFSHSGYTGYVDSHAMYYNNDIAGLSPLPNARAEYTIYDRLGNLVRTDVKMTDAYGLSWVPCYSDANGYGTYRYRVYLDNDRVAMEAPLAIEIQSDFSTDCGKAFEDQVNTGTYLKERAHVFANLDKAVRNSDNIFVVQRARIVVRLDPGVGYSTYDWNGSDKLIIDTQPNTGYGDQIWGTYAAYVHAHEYGHAYHQTALGGVKRYYNCPNPHRMHELTNLACALAEGFPDYFAVATMGSATGDIAADIELGRFSPSATNEWGYQPGANGAKIEGATASFLHDITDPANEPHDQMNYPGRYVADIIRTCEVYSGGWVLNAGTDHVAYCFLGTITDTGLFGRSPAPTSMREAATEPEAYETRYFKIRKNYQKNLFGYDV